MKTDVNGVSTCEAGAEKYETFTYRGETFYQYDYRTDNGLLFSCVAPTLNVCRANRNRWIWSLINKNFENYENAL